MTLSWRGLDQRAYYRLDGRGRDIDVTGCGNTLDLTHPVVARMVLDSLRYWVQECHVDGFRFDLAVALGRGKDDGYDTDHPFLVALRTDPCLSRAKLIAEPWDLGLHGWRTGQFPPPFSEWNDRYRDATRTFWLRDLAASASGGVGHGVRELATRLAGSQDLFDRHDRGTIASVNFVTAHDGFTLADLTVYDTKHNGANGHSGTRRVQRQPVVEPRRRGAHRRPRHRRGPAPVDAQPARHAAAVDRCADARRRRRDRPQPARQQQPVRPGQRDQLDVVGPRARGRRTCSRPPATSCGCVATTRSFASGPSSPAGRSTPTARPTSRGSGPTASRWATAGTDPRSRVLQGLYNGAAISEQSVLLVVNGSAGAVDVTLPAAPGVTAYELLWDSADERPAPPGDPVAGGRVRVDGCGVDARLELDRVLARRARREEPGPRAGSGLFTSGWRRQALRASPSSAGPASPGAWAPRGRCSRTSRCGAAPASRRTGAGRRRRTPRGRAGRPPRPTARRRR